MFDNWREKEIWGWTVQEVEFFQSVVHSLRSKGWSKIEAEDEALEKLERMRKSK